MTHPPSLSESIAAVRNDPMYAARSDLPSKLSFIIGGEEGDRLVLQGDTNKAAILRIVGQISRHNHNLRPYGTYNPGFKQKESQDVKGAKLRFYIIAPPNVDFANTEFDTFLENLEKIQDDCVDLSKAPFIHRPVADKMVTVLHPLVIPRDDEEDDDENMYSEHHDIASEDRIDVVETTRNIDSPSASPFSFEGWPVSPDGEWRRELDAVKGEYDIFPLQAFAKNGELIRPLDYVKRLLGAVVDMSFTLIHYNFTKKQGGSSRMCLQVTKLRVLVPPVPLPGSPTSKRGRVNRR